MRQRRRADGSYESFNSITINPNLHTHYVNLTGSLGLLVGHEQSESDAVYSITTCTSDYYRVKIYEAY